MLHEVELKRAIQAYLEGHEVKAILPTNDYYDKVVPFHVLFDEIRFLVDRSPAVINKEFDDAFQNPPNTEGTASGSSGSGIEPSADGADAGAKRKTIDRGKVMALHRAGWTNRKIADEMRVHESTVSRVIKDELEKETIKRIAGAKKNEV